ncbi:aminotransferase class I/II-fold pyridoxal phosphate-dependent enzyme [Nitrospirillum sp. BR 11828]|uniref:aminotransferase class I/II-fold pyridoxal phosphate-dependent enzyme n=1 Tax=Nitrospirillum sp. BR 11828 TaxID=3104325 RepID=UPI002ACAD0C4|nr:aminotransferase class I/II-fold pyridoxal phosphate-dependent enzyme [Nitrospirillum sp. BR 11828]MDZ5647472.1 aminotransferase class I/II-fold pyridoxal phosphate-dependent enzyme [Nitrospirillum sp. BR 11828]
MQSLTEFAEAKLAEMDAAALRRRLVDSDRDGEGGLWITRGGRRLLSFSCNDYLNLAHDPRVKAAAVAAVERYGVGAAASRLVTGNHPLYTVLEQKLAALKGTEAACVFGSGYLANAGIIPTFVGAKDLVVVDELAHACIWAGAKLSGATLRIFRHNDVGHAAQVLATYRPRHGRALLVTDGVFSMDGDLAPLPALASLCERHDTWLMTDDAHGIGVLAQGRGSSFAFGDKVQVPLQMGTLSKAVGGYGGYLCASQAVIDLVKTRARTLIYSTGLPPATVAGAIASLDIIQGDPDLCALPLAKARRFTALLNLPAAESPIVPIVLGGAEVTLRAQRLLEEEGLLVTAIRPPTVPAGTARLRVTFTARTPDAEIERLAGLIRDRILPLKSVESPE